MNKYPSIREKFDKEFLFDKHHSIIVEDLTTAVYFGYSSFINSIWSFIEQSLEETEKRVREDERVMFGKKVRSFFKEGEMYIDIANRVLGYIDGLLTQPTEEKV